MTTRRGLLVLGVLALFAAIGTVILWRPREEPQPSPGRPPQQPPAGPGQVQTPGQAPPEAGPRLGPGMAALVNGEPISRTELDAGIDRETYGLMMDEARKSRLDRLVVLTVMRQHLAAKGIKIPDEDVKKELDELRRNPPAAGCSCCRYSSVEDFLVANMMTFKDLRDAIRNDLGLERHARALWTAEFPVGKAREALVKQERAQVEKNYVKMSQIFFNTFQQPDFQTEPDKVREAVKAKAAAAWGRLEKGEDFAKLARECSEDAFSREEGGGLGCVPKDTFGRAVESAVEGLRPGARCAPVESPWGFHILRRDEMGDADILETLQTEYVDRKMEELSTSAQRSAKIERFDQPPGKG